MIMVHGQWGGFYGSGLSIIIEILHLSPKKPGLVSCFKQNTATLCSGYIKSSQDYKHIVIHVVDIACK